MFNFAAPDWFIWGLILTFAFPLMMIGIGELLEHRATGSESRFLVPLSILRNTLLPALFLDILLRRVVGFDAGHIAVKIADTVLGIVALNCALAFMNVLVFGEQSALSGRMRIPRLLLDILRLFFVACGAAIVISTVWNVNLGSLVTALGVGSVVIGLALQDTLGSLFSGIALVSARHFGVGDWIKFGTDEGPVLSMNWRSVTIRTRAGDALVLPNGVIARQPVTVITGGQGSTSVGVDLRFPYEYSPDLICAIMLEAATKTKDFHLDPPPAARVAAFDENGIRYGVAVRATDPAKLFAVRSEYLANVWYLAQRRKVVFPGQYNTRFAIPKDSLPQDITTKVELVRVAAALGTFPPDSDETLLDGMLANARIERFRNGQLLVEQGQVASHVHLIVRGRARAIYTTDSKSDVQLHEFERAQMVLSKSTLRSQPEPFTIKANGELEVIAIPPGDFKEACTHNHHLARELEQILSAREEAADRALAKAIPDHAGNGAEGDRVHLLKQMFHT